MKVEFTIPGQPWSMKNNMRIVPMGKVHRLIKEPELQEYMKRAHYAIPDDCRLMLEGPLVACFRLFYESNRPDLDEAALLDIMQPIYVKVPGAMVKIAPGEYQEAPPIRKVVSKGVYHNDRQVRERHVFFAVDKVNPRAEIIIETMQMQQVSLLDEEGDAAPPEDSDPF